MTDKITNKFFKVYIYISLFLIVVLLASIVGLMIYGGYKIKNETSTVTNKVNDFNQSFNSVNKNLENINTQLQKQNDQESKLTTEGL
jgi:predicted PurR-regulated permease PerM